MVREPEILVRLRRLQAEIAVDIAALKERHRETRELAARWDAQGTLGRPELVLVAVNLHGWYTALETGLERVARLLDQSMPSGASWHLDLLEQMRLDMPGLRGPLFPAEALPELHELRKFRHFFRNAYVLDLDATKVRGRARDLEAVAAGVIDHLERLERALTRAIAELAAGA
ncbi:MAG TPA: hypothetical protein VHH90_00050 [Polyangia bacterium]|nr:hypothetical protein [Polyangia bacterium]